MKELFYISSALWFIVSSLDWTIRRATENRRCIIPSAVANEFNFNVHERMMEPTDAPYKRREREMQTEKERDVEKTRNGTGHEETPRTLNAY